MQIMIPRYSHVYFAIQTVHRRVCYNDTTSPHPLIFIAGWTCQITHHLRSRTWCHGFILDKGV